MNLLLVSILSLIFSFISAADIDWVNDFDMPFNFSCPIRESVSVVKSVHNDHHEDRQWAFECKPTFDSDPECFWSGYANEFDEEFKFECQRNYVMTGMSSYHDNHHEDRRWKFECCRAKGFLTQACQWTTDVNHFDKAFRWQVPSLNYLAGAASVHSNHHEDRLWSYLYCLTESK